MRRGGRKVSKSAIVEAALLAILGDPEALARLGG
jgi:hypothetical protein